MPTFNDASTRWTAENKKRAPETIRREGRLLSFASERIGAHMIEAIKASTLLALRLDALRIGWSHRSANYLIQTIRTILRACSGWDWIDRDPPYIRPLRLPAGRNRWLTPTEASALIEALPVQIAQMATVAMETGLRRSNVTGLRWEWVDLNQRSITIPAEVVKNREPLHIPLTDRSALAIADRTQHRDAAGWVFHRSGKRIQQPCGRAWLSALEKLGIEDFRWHDLRHTWASWHVQAGTELPVLKQLGGWKTLSMVDRYAHLTMVQKQAAAVQLDLWRSIE